MNKFFQLLGFAHLYLLGGLAPPPSLFGLGVGAALVLWGQALNVGIYRAIGKKGVYYGHRLGLPADWYVGFPFTVAPHPQYMGVCMSVIGVNAFAATDRHVKAGWFNLTTIQVLYYVYMGLVEDYL